MIKKATILVVEDDSLVRDVITLMLQPDYDLLGAGSVRDALSALVLSPVDLVIVDCVLPDAPSEAVTTFADRAGVATMLMTGHIDHMLASEHAGRACLFKPFGPAELRAAISRTIGAPGRSGAASRFLSDLPIAWRPANAAVAGARHASPLLDAIAAKQLVSGRTAELIARARDCARQTECLRESQTFLRETRAAIVSRFPMEQRGTAFRG